VRVVVDANVLVALAVPTDYSSPASEKVRAWMAADVAMFAPTLWSYEAASALRKSVASGRLSHDAALQAISNLLQLGIREVNPALELLNGSLGWADRLQALVVYDSAYLAVAELLGADLWTADRKLANRARFLELNWVRHITEL
jgi:predicted nucleic acid-binding protein